MDIKLKKIERQLLLYDIFRFSEEVSFEDITSRLPIGRKMIQRDIEELTNAGLIRVKYSKKRKAYVHDEEEPPAFNENAGGKMLHLRRLQRLSILMLKLYTDRDSHYYDDGDDYFSCKKCYYELFSDATERKRQRDFRTLCNIGYRVCYDNSDRRYRMWEGRELREDFGVYRENGKLMRHNDEIYDML